MTRRKYRLSFPDLAWFLILMLFCLPAHAQDDVKTITASLEENARNVFKEDLYVATDKEQYVAGEILWMRLFYTDAQSRKPAHLSKVAYAELTDAHHVPVQQLKISLLEHEASGSFSLPLSLPSGTYTLRAYTSWMKNFGAENFFQKTITVINASKGLTATAFDTTVQPVINLYPEGGQMVYGLASHIACRVQDRFGKGMNYKAWLVDMQHDTLATISAVRFGMASFNFIPKEDHVYTLNVQTDHGRIYSRQLPEAKRSGYTIALTPRAENLNLVLQSNVENHQNFYMLVYNRGRVLVAEKKSTQNGNAEWNFEKKKLQEGINHIVLLDDTRHPVAERLYFIRPQMQSTLEIAADKKEYPSRSKVSLNLTTENKSKPAETSLSLSVVWQASLPFNLVQHYWLGELGDQVESPEYYLSPGTDVEEVSDLLMRTSGWSRFAWKQANETADNFNYPPEYNGHLVQAQIFDNNNQPAREVQAFFSVPGLHYQLDFDESNTNGNLQFEMKRFYGKGPVFVKPFHADDSLYHIRITNPFSENFAPGELPVLDIKNLQKEAIETQYLSMQTHQHYWYDAMNRYQQPDDSLHFFGIPDYVYKLDDYVRFTTMEEVLREYVRPINVSNTTNGHKMIMFNEKLQKLFDNNILALVDGVPIYNFNEVFRYDPLKVKSLEIIPRAFVIGPVFFNGIASFNTYKDEFDGYELDPHLVSIDYEGLALQREFHAPEYNTEAAQNSTLPDYRHTLYWSPELFTREGKATLSFYTGDLKGRFTGLVQGLDSEGHPYAKAFEFTVR